jgi:ribosomal protein L37E
LRPHGGKTPFMKVKKPRPPTHVACHHCGTQARPRWAKKHEMPIGIALLGSSICPKCGRPALHIKGDPEAVAEVTAMFEMDMGLRSMPEAHLTDMATGKPRLDG